MTTRVRRAGRLVEPDGTATVWSVAEGRRGRRWRWTTLGPRGAVGAHALETGPDGRFLRLESVRPGNLLTLHLEADGSIHGNRVTPTGVDHLAFGPSGSGGILVGTGRVGTAVFAAGLPAVAEAAAVGAIIVSDDLGVSAGSVRVRPAGRRSLELELDDRTWSVELDAEGLPVATGRDGGPWPLEEA